ncbi:MAG: hypothetical protein H6492_02885 [Candidatus Paracaedibacteraceae bacterium]|nr:hypothetical protein [Candidatus Paracaedibacteraceae bacterium]
MPSIHGAIQKDLNFTALKKAQSWLLNSIETSNEILDSSENITDLTNTDHVWNVYLSIIKSSLSIVKKHPQKIQDHLHELFNHKNKDILPLIIFYLYASKKKGKTLQYYDIFNIEVAPVNQNNLWIVLIPFNEISSSKKINFTAIILDMQNNQIFFKD